MADSYKCAMCGGEFLKTWSDEEAVVEMESYFGEVPESMRAIVCDDCYQKIHPKDHPEAVAKILRR